MYKSELFNINASQDEAEAIQKDEGDARRSNSSSDEDSSDDDKNC